MTNREFFVAVVNNAITEEVIAHAQESIQKLDARSSKTDDENRRFGESILQNMEVGRKYLCNELTTVGKYDYTTSKVTAIMKTLAKDGKIQISEVRVGNSIKKAYEVIQ